MISIKEFSELPMEMLIEILLFDGRIKYRNGKFINQILKTDERYNTLLLIKPMKCINSSGLFNYFLAFSNNHSISYLIGSDICYIMLNEQSQILAQRSYKIE